MALAEKIEKKIHLRVITPTATTVDDSVDMVILRAITGDMGILPEHEPYLCVLDDGVLRILEGDTERRVAVFGGIAEIQGTAITVLTEEARRPQEIDLEQAKAKQAQLELEIKEKDDIDRRAHQAQLRRAIAEVDVASFPH